VLFRKQLHRAAPARERLRRHRHLQRGHQPLPLHDQGLRRSSARSALGRQARDRRHRHRQPAQSII